MDYTVYRTDRCLMTSTKAKGGGVLIAVRRSLASALLIQAMDDSLEQLWVTIKTDKLNVVIGAIYIPPNLRNEVEIIDRHISSVERAVNSTSINDDVLIFGDYNRAGLSWSIHTDGNYLFVDASRSSINAVSSHLLDGMAFQCMHQINPVCNQNGRFLDLVFVNSHALPACSVTTAPDPLCNIDVHHPPLMVSFDRPVEGLFIDEFDSSSFDFRRGNYDAIESELRGIDWTFINRSTDLDEAVSGFTEFIQELIHRHIPKARPRRKPIWGNRHLTKLNRLLDHTKHYRLYTMFVRKTKRSLRLNPKSFWRFVNSKRKEEGLPSSVFLLNSEASTNNSKCDLFTEHFASVFNKEHASPNDIAAAMASVPSDVFNADVFEITIGEVSKAICDLKQSYSPGPDGIPAVLLKKCAGSLESPLAAIFNLSLLKHQFPRKWKESLMFPVYKKGDKRNVENFRGISCLCACSKVFETIMHHHLMFSVKNYISTAQHGFFPWAATLFAVHK
ncbi:uncharacterized protein LOC129716894 [Wyeomyia smithii]|uniref:uncharacterized protein LOC129716894 n=1 Tax=Wyeomyia smithii TaxID=174621 RepID=UPI002467C12F|nr:uncharacterized protein LOC129716894 [Wyeomyia smithii]